MSWFTRVTNIFQKLTYSNYFSVSNEIRPDWPQASLVTVYKSEIKNFWKSVQKQRREGEREKRNYKNGNFKAFCTTHKRKKLQERLLQSFSRYTQTQYDKKFSANQP